MPDPLIAPVALLYENVFPDGSEQPHTVMDELKKFSAQHGGLCGEHASSSANPRVGVMRVAC